MRKPDFAYMYLEPNAHITWKARSAMSVNSTAIILKGIHVSSVTYVALFLSDLFSNPEDRVYHSARK